MEAAPLGAEPAPEFDFSGGRASLDLANTVGGRGREVPRDDLRSYAHLVAWGLQAGLIVEAEAEALQRAGVRRPDEATKVLDRAVTLREAIYRVMFGVAMDEPPRAADLSTINAELANGLAYARVVPTGDRFAWGWEPDIPVLDRVLWPVARDAAELLTSDLLDRVRVCGDRHCGWVFMDTSKNRSRQWCDMKVCGNRAKARRHYERRRGTEDGRR
jgi:predicted RNA-binding Zn ribbon-like protein